jgi:hypothetical protein
VLRDIDHRRIHDVIDSPRAGSLCPPRAETNYKISVVNLHGGSMPVPVRVDA